MYPEPLSLWCQLALIPVITVAFLSVGVGFFVGVLCNGIVVRATATRRGSGPGKPHDPAP